MKLVNQITRTTLHNPQRKIQHQSRRSRPPYSHLGNTKITLPRMTRVRSESHTISRILQKYWHKNCHRFKFLNKTNRVGIRINENRGIFPLRARQQRKMI